MKRAAEVERSVRCSEEPATDQITKKRLRKADKPSKKEKKAEEEKKKRSKKNKKRAEEKRIEKQADGDGFIDCKKEKRTKKPTMGDEVMLTEMEDDNAAGGGMTKLSQELLDYLRTKEVMGLLATEAPLLPWAKRMADALFESDQRFKQETAAEFQENREFDAHVLYQYRTYGHAYAEIIKETGTEEKSNKKKKKLVTQEINQAEMRHHLSDEIWHYVMSIGVSTFEDAVISEIGMSSRDPSIEAMILDYRIRHIENKANLLRQYRTNGHVVLQYEVTDDERDVEEV